MPIFALLCACTKSTMRLQAACCASFHRPGQPGVMRPSGVGLVISTNTMAGAAQRARAQVHQVEVLRHAVDRAVLAIGETTMRFFSVQRRAP